MMIEIQVPEGARLASDGGADTGPTLAEIRPGATCKVRAVRGAEDLRRRLLEMGFVSGTDLRVVRLAPMGDPMQIELHGYHISLRRAEAREILVRPAS